MPHQDPNLDALLERNRTWARALKESQPDFFERLAQQQAPHYLWIGCADSRVPANQILGLPPGEIFVHRNVANVVVHSDLNCLSVIQYALEVLKISHIIVCGHYGCGGVSAALHDTRAGLIDNWLRHVQDVRNRNRDELRELKDDHARLKRLCELNALAQAINVAQTTLLRDAWERKQPVSIHAMVYGLEDGILHKLGASLTDPESLQRRKRELGW